MQKLTTKQIIDSIKRNIWWILIPALLLGGLIFGTRVLKSGVYEAEAVLMVTSNDDKPITYNKLILNEKLANVYSQFLESKDLYEAVEKKANDPKLTGDDIEGSLEYEVNPQGGVISFTYRDDDENAGNILTLITEEFRAYANQFLAMENIEYLQNVTVAEASKTRGIIFSIAGLILGALLGTLCLIIKEILSDKINSADDIREMGVEVLADLSGENPGEYAKIHKKLTSVGDSLVIGLAPFSDKENIPYEKIAHNTNSPLIDPETMRGSDDGLLDIKYQINKLGQDSPYIFIKEKSVVDPLGIYLSDLEDYKIILVDKKTAYKKSLETQINEFERLGIGVLGVIYY